MSNSSTRNRPIVKITLQSNFTLDPHVISVLATNQDGSIIKVTPDRKKLMKKFVESAPYISLEFDELNKAVSSDSGWYLSPVLRPELTQPHRSRPNGTTISRSRRQCARSPTSGSTQTTT